MSNQFFYSSRPPQTKICEKVLIPQDEYPDINFVGLIIGPRGNTLKGMERDVSWMFQVFIDHHFNNFFFLSLVPRSSSEVKVRSRRVN